MGSIVPSRRRVWSPLFRLDEESASIRDEVVGRVTRKAIREGREHPERAVEALLGEAAHDEIARLEERGQVGSEPYLYWQQLVQSVALARDEQNADQLRQIARRYIDATVGHFSPTAFKLATTLVPAGVALALSREARHNKVSTGAHLSSLADRVRIEGDLPQLRHLAQRGTLVFAPTHSSHVDNLLIGWAIHESRLPAVVYGAELSLFKNPLTAPFMGNVGAYRVDRRVRNTIYRMVLKEYSEALIERGYHSLFFPSGMRSRTNEIESRLKLGLLGTAVDAYVRNVVERRVRPNVYVVPVVINYLHVLEAETLIEDHLRHGGKGRYIIDVDEFSSPRRVAEFIHASLDLDAPISVRFCAPTDVFGNTVDAQGESLSPLGRRVDPASYLRVNGVPAVDAARDRQYTRELGERLVEAYARNNCIYPLHIVSFALFEHLRRQQANWDFAALFRFARDMRVSLAVLAGETERLHRLATKLGDEGRLRLAPEAQTGDATELIRSAASAWRVYHKPPIVDVSDTHVQVRHMRLLYFYGNRLRGYGLEKRLGEVPGGYRHVG